MLLVLLNTLAHTGEGHLEKGLEKGIWGWRQGKKTVEDKFSLLMGGFILASDFQEGSTCPGHSASDSPRLLPSHRGCARSFAQCNPSPLEAGRMKTPATPPTGRIWKRLPCASQVLPGRGTGYSHFVPPGGPPAP